jgi:hypothetical protein
LPEAGLEVNMRDFPESDDPSRMPVPSTRDRETENAPNALSVLNSVFGLPGFRGA